MRYLKSLSLGLILAFSLTGCASTAYLKDQDATRVYNLSKAEMFVLVPQAVDLAGMKMREVKESEGVVLATAPPSFWTSSLGNMMAGGDEVIVNIKEIQVSQSSVFIKVIATMNAVDMGRSARVVKTLFKYIDQIVQQKISSKS